MRTVYNSFLICCFLPILFFLLLVWEALVVMSASTSYIYFVDLLSERTTYKRFLPCDIESRSIIVL